VTAGPVTPEAERQVLDLLARANRSGITSPSLVARAERIERHLNITTPAEPPRSIGDLIDRFGDDLYLCFNLTAIGGPSASRVAP
jgi:hypothetical protein